MLIPELIEYVNGVFYNSLSEAELNKACAQLKDCMENRTLIEQNFLRADGLKYRINAKYLAIKYFDGGYLEEDYQKLFECLQKGLVEVKEKNYTNTIVLYQNLLEIVTAVHGVVFDVAKTLGHIIDANGSLITDQLEQLEYVINFLEGKKQAINTAVCDNVQLFKKGVKFFDVKAKVIRDLDEQLYPMKEALVNLDMRDAKSFITENFSEITKEYSGVAYYEKLVVGDGNTANTIVVSSPLKDEVYLFANKIECNRGCTFLEVSAFAFNNKKQEFIDKVFTLLKEQKVSLIVLGLETYHTENKQYLLKKLVELSNCESTVLVVENNGEKSAYSEIMEVCKTTEGFSILDVCFQYLRMPTFIMTSNILIEKKMIEQTDTAFIQKNMAYMGYVGLNKMIQAFLSGKEWKDIGVATSLEHYAQLGNYLNNLPSQDQFISHDWVDLKLVGKGGSTRADFDYDSVYSVNPKNIKKILEGNFNMFVKCGLIARYCTLCGNDYSVWATLDIKEREARVNTATRLVAYLLGCSYEPEVKIIPNKDWKSKGAGGLCIGGGKRIEYKDDCSLNYTWLIDAVCHECYHSFQHTLIENGVRDWHFRDFGVSVHRVNEWNANFQHYVDIDQNETYYMQQVTEADARIFAAECIHKSADNMNLLNLE